MKGRILVIDDSEVVLARVQQALASAGFEVVTTTNPVGNARYLVGCDLVIIDFHMPGIDGGTVVSGLRRALQQAGRTCPLYMYTSDGQAAARHARLGFDGCFTDKGDEQVELLQLDRSGIRVAAYLTEMPPKRLLEQKLHETTARAKAHLEARGAGPKASE